MKRRGLSLKAGDVVRVRSAKEIIATLDSKGALNGLPFMPEMLAACGKEFRVFKRADKTCDTINYSGSRRMYDTVHLEGLRCNGSAHGGCEARCLMYWNEMWLERVDAGRADPLLAPDAHLCTLEDLFRETRVLDQAGSEPVFNCQATKVLIASEPLAWWDVRQYARDVLSRNITIMQVVRAAAFRVYLQLLKVGAYRALRLAYDKIQKWRDGTPWPFTHGTQTKTPRATLDLQPGEWVRVKSQEEILATVDKRNRNSGLSFDPEMVRFCNRVYRVLARVNRIIDERTGKMIELSRDCIILDAVCCHAEYSDRRLFCPRSLYPFWREIWLTRVEQPSDVSVVRVLETSP